MVDIIGTLAGAAGGGASVALDSTPSGADYMNADGTEVVYLESGYNSQSYSFDLPGGVTSDVTIDVYGSGKPANDWSGAGGGGFARKNIATVTNPTVQVTFSQGTSGYSRIAFSGQSVTAGHAPGATGGTGSGGQLNYTGGTGGGNSYNGGQGGGCAGPQGNGQQPTSGGGYAGRGGNGAPHDPCSVSGCGNTGQSGYQAGGGGGGGSTGQGSGLGSNGSPGQAMARIAWDDAYNTTHDNTIRGQMNWSG